MIFSQIKHPRGKHDQRDHGRRAAGGGVSAIRDTITSLNSEDQNTIIATTKNEQDRALAQRRSKHPNDVLFLQELQQDIRSYTGKDSRLRRAERERKYVLAEAKRQGGNLSAFQQTQLRSAEKDILEAITTIESYRSQFNETLSRIREDRKRIQRDQRKAKTRKVSLDTQTPFESLDGFGLKGWRRQRPDTPPDYAAYDQATPGRPAWMEDQRWDLPTT